MCSFYTHVSCELIRDEWAKKYIEVARGSRV